MFGYIQDAKTLGTIFINGIAYTLCTAASSFKLMVKLDNEIVRPNHDHDYNKTEDAICLPGLRYG